MFCELKKTKGLFPLELEVARLSLRFSGVSCLDFMTGFHPRLTLFETSPILELLIVESASVKWPGIKG